MIRDRINTFLNEEVDNKPFLLAILMPNEETSKWTLLVRASNAPKDRPNTTKEFDDKEKAFKYAKAVAEKMKMQLRIKVAEHTLKPR